MKKHYIAPVVLNHRGAMFILQQRDGTHVDYECLSVLTEDLNAVLKLYFPGPTTPHWWSNSLAPFSLFLSIAIFVLKARIFMATKKVPTSQALHPHYTLLFSSEKGETPHGYATYTKIKSQHPLPLRRHRADQLDNRDPKAGSRVRYSPRYIVKSDLYWEKNAKIKTGYKREHINLGCDVDFDIAGPSIRGALVLGYEGWLTGYQMNFETSKFRVTQSNFAVGYKTDEFQLHTNVNDGTEFGGSIYQKVNKKLETAINLAWTAGNSNTRFGIAAKYQVDPDACFSVKVNNSSLIGLGYTQMLSALLDGKNVNVGGHKLGLGLEFQA
ncbi:voltage-dependent anion-selective channel protein 1-like [Rattus rattus]|uniref:voltage-dependent anion-selective channel protein 1-like n=1 Tax=Rattus rattus TaxID=10117 RepID=UPI0013F340C7|nr:voltage-dependent anion-selective channel protein 1-like [Rattus rattus]